MRHPMIQTYRYIVSGHGVERQRKLVLHIMHTKHKIAPDGTTCYETRMGNSAQDMVRLMQLAAE